MLGSERTTDASFIAKDLSRDAITSNAACCA
jgi:hypothetical protein